MNLEECLRYAHTESFIEVRLDLLDLNQETAGHVFSESKKSIATCRPGKHSDKERMSLLYSAISAGADYVDLELEATREYKTELIKHAREKRCDVIISYHNFESTPAKKDLKKIVKKCVKEGADVVKIACKVNQKEDLSRLMGLYSGDQRMVVLGMGKSGLITRIAAPILGGEFTFASTGQGRDTAPGQPTREQLEEIYRIMAYHLNS